MLHSQDDPNGKFGESICVMYKVNSSGTDLRRKCRSQAQQLAINHSFVIKERGLNNVAGSAGVQNGD